MTCQDPDTGPIDEATKKETSPLADEEEEEEKKEISPLTGEKEGKHESWGKKYLTQEQHEAYWDQAAHWCFDRFSEAKWRAIVCRIERAAKEDNFIVFGWHPPQQPARSVTIQTRHPPLLHSSSSLTLPTGPHPLRPSHLPRIATASPTTARPRWDVVISGPVTPLSPLSPVSGPVKNAFAEGGVWASLSPKTPASLRSVSTNPISAVLAEHWTPDAPQSLEAKIAYDGVQRGIKKMALQLCANRLAIRRSCDGEHDVIHPSMVKPKDKLLASEVFLESLHPNISQNLYLTLPDKIEHLVDVEAAYLREHSIQTPGKLMDIDFWLRIDESTGDMTTILEAQRDLLRMNRLSRKNQVIHVSEHAVQCAWATKILSDWEYIVDNNADAESLDSNEDFGYAYDNFVRSLHSPSCSTLGEAYAKSAVSSEYLPDSPETSIPVVMNDIEHQVQQQQQQQQQKTRSSPTHTHTRRPNLLIKPSLVPYFHSNTTISPEERCFRRAGPSLRDLDVWADELKQIERNRTALMLEGVLHPALRCETPTSDPDFGPRGRRQTGCGERSSGASSASGGSWRCETASIIEDKVGTDSDTLVYEGCNDGEGKRMTPRLQRRSARASLKLEMPKRPPHREQAVPRQSKEVDDETWARELRRMGGKRS